MLYTYKPFIYYIYKSYIYIYIYIYICIIYTYIFSKHIYCIFVYFYMGQSFKEGNVADIKNCLALVVKVKSLKLITSRQCH